MKMTEEEKKALEFFGEKLKKWRTYASFRTYPYQITQELLANKLSMSRTYISQLETGQRNPSFLTILKIVKFFDVSYSVFFEGPENYKSSERLK